MAQPTVTRQDIRNQIGLLLQEPFFTRVGGAGALTGTPTTTVLADSVNLGQKDNAWKNSWVYMRTGDAAGEVRRISASAATGATVTLETALSTAPTAADQYEIWSNFTPHLVNNAINLAIRNSWPEFPNVEEQFIVIREDVGNRYDLTNTAVIGNQPQMLMQVWHERPASTLAGTATAGGSATLTNTTDAHFVSGTHDDGTWEVRIYFGTGAGQIRTVSNVDSTSQITVSTAWTTQPDSTSKYRLVRIGDGLMSYEFMTQWHVDRNEWPTLWVPNGHPYGYEGYAFRLITVRPYTELSDETTTTSLNESYLIYHVLASAYTLKQASAPSSESRSWAILQTQATEQLENYIEKHKTVWPESTMHEDGGPARRYAADYPFREG
jgi:hypothetical protein